MAQLISGTTIAGHSAIHAGNLSAHSIATTSYVTTQINNLINGAPGVLDTLNELAAALGDDANFATTIATSVGTKLSIASNLSDVDDAPTALANIGGATAAQGAKADTAVQPATLANYATAAQGAKADTAVQPAAIASMATVSNVADAKAQAISAAAADATTKANTAQAAAIAAAATDASTKSTNALNTAKTYTDTKVSALVAAAPGALDTLAELSAALGNDADFAVSTATAIGDRLIKSANLSDLTSASLARANLGLGTAATLSSGTFATAAQGALADTAVQPAAIANMAETTDVATAKSQAIAAAAFKTTASLGAPFSPAKIAVVILAFSAASPPASAEMGALGIEKSKGSSKSLDI